MMKLARCTRRCAGHRGRGVYRLGTDAPRRSRPSCVPARSRRREGPEQYFTGKVRVDPVFAASADVPFGAAYVTFEPGARSAWHTHPAGQRLVVTAGVGRTGVWGGPVVEIKAGDAVWCPPGVKHWHGAAPGSAMTHLAITGQKEGQSVVWMEKVSDVQYGR